VALATLFVPSLRESANFVALRPRRMCIGRSEWTIMTMNVCQFKILCSMFSPISSTPERIRNVEG
jgi:hypothetical protein